MQEAANQPARQSMSVVAILLSIVAIVLSTVALMRSKKDDSYDRIVGEVWAMVEPVLDDFDLIKPDQPPTTLTEALQPLLEVAQPIDESAQ